MRVTRRTVLRSAATAVATGSTVGECAAGEASGLMESDYRNFVRDHPTWATTARVDAMRRDDYPRLVASGEAYLDYTGASLHSDSQVQRHVELLRSTLLGNPHSAHRASRNATARIDSARAAVLRHLRAAPNDYLVIFTQNATGGLRIVGESYPFGPRRPLLLTQDNHNSVNGIAEFAKRAGAGVARLPVTAPHLRIDRAAVNAAIAPAGALGPGLFAFPAQSNFSGVRHPLDLVAAVKSAGWDVLLDAAAFVPTCPLDLSTCRPDYVCMSFYKMFGYPTGVGCLVARREAVRHWRRPWFSGGTVKLASVAADAFVPADGAAAFEDGTVDFLSLPAVEIGLDHLARIGIDTIHERVRCLTSWTLGRMRGLRHRSGRPLVRLLGPEDVTDRGGTIAFALRDRDGGPHDIRRICATAAAAGIALRSGFFCNPGAGEAAFGLTAGVVAPILARRANPTFDQLRADVRTASGDDVGALRASFGIVSDFSDAWRLGRFLEGLLDATAREAGTEPAGG